jgi:hypothetical protein
MEYIAHRHMNVEMCGRTFPFLEIFVANFRYCVFAVYTSVLVFDDPSKKTPLLFVLCYIFFSLDQKKS